MFPSLERPSCPVDTPQLILMTTHINGTQHCIDNNQTSGLKDLKLNTNPKVRTTPRLALAIKPLDENVNQGQFHKTGNPSYFFLLDL